MILFQSAKNYHYPHRPSHNRLHHLHRSRNLHKQLLPDQPDGVSVQHSWRCCGEIYFSLPPSLSGGDEEQGDGDVDDEYEVEKLEGGDGYDMRVVVIHSSLPLSQEGSNCIEGH